MTTLHPWLQPTLTTVLATRGQCPHAIMLQGPAGLGLPDLAMALAHALLCDTPTASGEACGKCVACTWLAAGTHPDLVVLRPGDGDEDTGKKASTQIRIEAVRMLIETLALSPHHGGRRVVIIDPVDAMNTASANALLKLLEEPPPGNVLILLNHAPQRVLPTVRSRCVQVPVARPSATQLAQYAPESTADGALLAFCQSPLADEPARARWPLQAQLLDALERGNEADLPAASRIAGISLAAALEALAKWCHDLARVQAGGTPRFLPSRDAALRGIASRASVLGILHMSERLKTWQRHAEHPLNVPLTLADILLEYRSEAFPRSPRA